MRTAIIDEIQKIYPQDKKLEKYYEGVKLTVKEEYIKSNEILAGIIGYRDSDTILKRNRKKIMEDAKIGDKIEFGNYNGAIYWLVLERSQDSLLLISQNVIEYKQYNEKKEHTTWEESSLRKWLNGEFINNAFDATERNSIISSKVKAERNPEYIEVYPGIDTVDKVFLLSISEVNKYFESSSHRICKANEYCHNHREYKRDDGSGACNWWLRSPGDNADHACYVSEYGTVFLHGHYVYLGSGRGGNYDFIGVRPVLRLNLNSLTN